MNNPYFEFHNGVKLLCGETALSRIAWELKQLGASRPLVLSDAVLNRIGTLRRVVQAMEAEGCPPAGGFTDIPVDSSLAVVNRIAAYYRDLHCDALVAVGGGSVLDTAKGVRLVLSQEVDDLLSISGFESLPKGRDIPFIAVPTTCGTGSECTGVAVIRNDETQVKMEFLSPYVEPDVAVLDPVMTESLPPKATASTGMDALTHAIEAATCLQANPLSTAYATAAMELLTQNIVQATRCGSDKKARYAMALGSTMAGIAFSNSMVGLVHAVGHALGGVCHVPHAVAMMILLPHVMRYNLPKIASSYAALLPHLVGGETAEGTPVAERAGAAIAAVEALSAQLSELTGLPRSLHEEGVSKDSFARVAEVAVNDGAIIVNPRAAGEAEILDILNAAY